MSVRQESLHTHHLHLIKFQCIFAIVNQFPYVDDSIRIEAQSTQHFQAFVTKFSNSQGSDDWFPIPSSFNADGTWHRGFWDFVAIRNESDTDRRGFYFNAKNHTIYIIVRSLNDIDVISAKNPAA